MTDDPFRTRIETAEQGTVDFQDYFVRLRHDVAVTRSGVRPCDDARASPAARRAHRRRRRRDRAVEPAGVGRTGPRAAGVDALLAASPRLGGGDLADRRWSRAQGTGRPDAGRARPRGSVVGVARLYREVAATLVIDDVDAALADGGRGRGHALRAWTATVMADAGGRRGAGPDRARRRCRRVSGSGRGRRRASSTATSRGGCGPAPATARSAASSSRRGRRRLGSGADAPATVRHRSRTGSAPGADVDHQPAPARPARASASTTSSTNTKSRVWRPSPVITGGRPLGGAWRNAATTPSPGRWLGPYTEASASAVNSTRASARGTRRAGRPRPAPPRRARRAARAGAP
jgi:hypothetical protein